MALSMIKSLKDIAGFTRALIEYLSLKNKELYSGTAEWKSGSKTIPGISKYQKVKVYLWDDLNGIELERVSDTRLRGEGMVQGVSSATVHTSIGIDLICDGDKVTFNYGNLIHHPAGGSHGSAVAGWVKRIVGTEPIIPDALAEYIRGGYCVRLGGGIHAKLAKVLAGYRQCLAEDFCWHADGQPENRAVIDTVGEHVIKNDSHYGNKKYNISNSIQCKANSDWPMYRFNSIPGLVQYYRVQHTKHVFYHGVQEQLQHLLHISRSLDCHRQSIAPRGCCHV